MDSEAELNSSGIELLDKIESISNGDQKSVSEKMAEIYYSSIELRQAREKLLINKISFLEYLSAWHSQVDSIIIGNALHE